MESYQLRQAEVGPAFNRMSVAVLTVLGGFVVLAMVAAL